MFAVCTRAPRPYKARASPAIIVEAVPARIFRPARSITEPAIRTSNPESVPHNMQFSQFF